MPDLKKINLGDSPSPIPAGNVPLENIPIHTMREDLKNISSGNLNIIEESYEPSGPTGSVPVRTTISPFLASKSPASAAPSSTPPAPTKTFSAPPSVIKPSTAPAPATITNPFQKTINPLAVSQQAEAEKPEENLSLKKTFFISGVIFLLLAMAAGGYYYWMSRQKKEVVIQPEPESVVTIPVETTEPTPTPAPVVAPVFSVDKPNYLVLDIKTADTAKIKAEIKDRSDKIIAADIKTPVEFVVSDANFTPLSFKFFAGTLKLNLPVKLIANIEDKFSLFIYKEEAKTKLGLLLDVKDEKLAKTQMTQAENLLVSQLAPLYMDISYTVKDKKFNNSQYGDLIIKYNNLTSDSTLSLDYAFSGKKLLIGTSKMTLRSIYNYTRNATTTTTTETTTSTTTTSETTETTTPKTE